MRPSVISPISTVAEIASLLFKDCPHLGDLRHLALLPNPYQVRPVVSCSVKLARISMFYSCSNRVFLRYYCRLKHKVQEAVCDFVLRGALVSVAGSGESW